MFEQFIESPYTAVTSASGVEYHVPFNHEVSDYAKAGTHWSMNEPLSALIKCEFAQLDDIGLPLFNLQFLVKPESGQELVYEYFRTDYRSRPSFTFTPEGLVISLTAYSVCHVSGEVCGLESVPAYQTLDQDDQEALGDDHYCVGRIFDIAAALWKRGEHESFLNSFNARLAAEPKYAFGTLDGSQLVEIMEEAEGTNESYYEIEVVTHTDSNGVEWMGMISEHED